MKIHNNRDTSIWEYLSIPGTYLLFKYILSLKQSLYSNSYRNYRTNITYLSIQHHYLLKTEEHFIECFSVLYVIIKKEKKNTDDDNVNDVLQVPMCQR